MLFFLALTFTSPPAAKSAPEPISLQVSINDPTSQMGGIPKSAITLLSVSYDGHTLYFDTPCDGCVLNIVDGNGVVVYTSIIPRGTAFLVLPPTLYSEFELQIISGNYLFYGTIDLP